MKGTDWKSLCRKLAIRLVEIGAKEAGAPHPDPFLGALGSFDVIESSEGHVHVVLKDWQTNGRPMSVEPEQVADQIKKMPRTENLFMSKEEWDAICNEPSPYDTAAYMRKRRQERQEKAIPAT